MIFGSAPRKKAIAYYRHSAEDKQENSIPIQRENIQKFARDHAIEIIHEEADEGKTGLLADRPGFTHIFDDWVLHQQAPHFDFVLVYDVSRWGRFQDQDEAAYYEFICRKHGKRVVYVAHGFPQEEHQLIAHLQTSIERYMAAEYSRQLSDKVFLGCVKVSQAGYSAGGTACYGMTRLLLDAKKQPVRVLNRGEHKSIDNERVTFTPLNDETTQIVQDIFRLFVVDGMSEMEISTVLNQRRISAPNGTSWNERKIFHILTNEAYIGNRIYNKTSNRLKRGHRNNPLRDWVVCQNAFLPVVDMTIFRQAQERIFWQKRSIWKRGVYTVQRTRNVLKQTLQEFFSRQGVSQNDLKSITKNFPLLTSVALASDNGGVSWCFTIPDSFKRYSEVIGVSVVLDADDPIDRFFVIPTRDFGLGGFIFFSENDTERSSENLSRPA